MFDEDKVGGALLTKKKYAYIEKKVVDLYIELTLSTHPLNPFSNAPEKTAYGSGNKLSKYIGGKL